MLTGFYGNATESKINFKKNSGLQTIRVSKSQSKQNMSKLGSANAVKQDGGHSHVAQVNSGFNSSNKAGCFGEKSCQIRMWKLKTCFRGAKAAGHVIRSENASPLHKHEAESYYTKRSVTMEDQTQRNILSQGVGDIFANHSSLANMGSTCWKVWVDKVLMKNMD